MSREIHVRFCEGLGLKCPGLLTLRISRSCRSCRFSLRSAANSSRSVEVSAPLPPPPASTVACLTQPITALGVNPSSVATPFGVFPGCWQSRTTSSLVVVAELTPLALLLRLLGHVFGTHLASLAMSKKSGQS